MKPSIRTKLFLSLSALILFFVLLSLGLTKLGLEKFYIWQKKDLLISSAQKIDSLYQGNPDKVALELERVANTIGSGLLIVTPDGTIKYKSFGPFINEKHEHEPPLPDRLRQPPPQVLKAQEFFDGQTTLEIQEDPQLRIKFMVLKRRLAYGDILFIRQPLAPVSESAAAAAQFMIFTGILSILAGCSWAFLFSKKFTRPILELNTIAQKMSQLDFSQKCIISDQDEIGELGHSINHLSDQLDTAISALNQKNQQLMADVERERALDGMRRNFVSSVSHELKTPLSLILGYAEGLQENVANDEESRNFYCSIIVDEAKKMDNLVKDLLNLAQFDSGVFQLNAAAFDLGLLIQDIALKYTNLLTEKSIFLQLEVSSGTFVYGDALRIEQVLSNLLNNAINHIDAAKVLKILVKNAGEHVRVSVYNSGLPIPQDSLEKIWSSFYKIDTARTREYGGFGLGLSIVRAIQDLHGNSYGVENGPAGVTFWFDLDKGDCP